MDPIHEKGSGLGDPGVGCPEAVAEQGRRIREPKCCTGCQTTKTPLWRGGPCGPKSLCNACGIRYRKKRRELLGLQGREKGQKQRKLGSKIGVLRVLGPGRDASLKPRTLLQLSQRCRCRRLGEVEEAAVLLRALSSGFIYAKA